MVVAEHAHHRGLNPLPFSGSRWSAIGAVVLASAAFLTACAPLNPPVTGTATPTVTAGPLVKTPSPAKHGQDAAGPTDSTAAPPNADAQAASPDSPYQLIESAPREWQRGRASWYGPGFHGRLTASGERYDQYALTAAHKTLPFGTLVRVRSLVNGREVDVRITDRGPFVAGRIIDVSQAAAEALGMRGQGVKDVLLLLPDALPTIITPAPAARGKGRARPRATAARRR